MFRRLNMGGIDLRLGTRKSNRPSRLIGKFTSDKYNQIVMKKVAVIGAGAAGLCALRLFSRCPKSSTAFQVTAFEQTSNVGGTWMYSGSSGDKDEYGIPVHSSMYKSLRTNLPKECMSFPDFPFSDGPESFIKHGDVQKYLESYATHNDLWKLIKFKTVVENVKPVPDANNEFGVRWEVTTADVTRREETKTEMFDAVLVCNGHYSRPLMPEIPGLDGFEGHVMHSHYYRKPLDAHINKTVLILGAKNSGLDICIELAKTAKKVYLCHRKPKLEVNFPPLIEQKPGIQSCNKRLVTFTDGTSMEADSIVLCTGYRYNFDFLDKSIGLTVEEERISPLFKHLISISYPSLCLVGIIKTVLPFPAFQTQIQYFRSILDGTGTVQSREEMLADEAKEFDRFQLQEEPARYFHIIAGAQFDYFRQLSDLSHTAYLPAFFEKIYNECIELRKKDIINYRNRRFILHDDEREFEVIEEKCD